MQEALAEYGVGDIMKPYIDAIAAGEPVPDDIRREVTNLRDAQRSLTGKIIPMAVRWVRREDAAHQLATELEQHLAQLTEETDQSAIEMSAPEQLPVAKARSEDAPGLDTW